MSSSLFFLRRSSLCCRLPLLLSRWRSLLLLVGLLHLAAQTIDTAWVGLDVHGWEEILQGRVPKIPGHLARSK